jgi:hypothetical protein
LRAAQELPGAPTISGGVPDLGVVVEGVKEVKEAFQPPHNIRQQCKNYWFPALIDLKIAEKAVFYLKALNKMYSRDVF